MSRFYSIQSKICVAKNRPVLTETGNIRSVGPMQQCSASTPMYVTHMYVLHAGTEIQDTQCNTVSQKSAIILLFITLSNAD